MRLPASRRDVLRSMAACSAGFGLPMLIPSAALGLADRPAPRGRTVTGLIGVGGLDPLGHGNQGSELLKSFLRRPEVQVAVVRLFGLPQEP